MVGTFVKAKVGVMEEDIKEGFLRRLRKDMNGVVHEVFGKKRYLVRLHNGLDKEILLKQITVVVVRSEV